MTNQEIKTEYEHNTGLVIIETLEERQLNALEMLACLVASDGPFTWGKTANAAVNNAVVLEEVAVMALGTLEINSSQPTINHTLLDKHYLRKHGVNAYYGQAK